MEIVILPQALMIFYGVLVLGCGSVLGFIAGRNLKRRVDASTLGPRDPLDRRVTVLEQELELSQRQLDALLAEREFMRELNKPVAPDGERPSLLGRRVA